MCIRDRYYGEAKREKHSPGGQNIRYQQTREGLSLIHISEPTRLGMISYAVFCLKKKRPPPRSTLSSSSAASDVYKRQILWRSKTGETFPWRTKYSVSADSRRTVSYTHLRAHETRHDIVCRLLLEKKTATTEIYTILFVGSVRCV